MHWWQLPSPGKTGFDRFASDTLADRFIIYLPASYHNTESWPLVVFLHGSGDRGDIPAVLREQEPLALDDMPSWLLLSVYRRIAGTRMSAS